MVLEGFSGDYEVSPEDLRVLNVLKSFLQNG